MSETTVGDAIIRFRPDTSGISHSTVTKEGEKAGKSYKSGVSNGVKGLAALIGGAFAVTKIAGFLKGTVAGAIEDQASQRRLAVALKNTTGATKEQDAALESWISRVEVAKGVTDNDLRAGLQRLVQATGSVTKSQKLMNLALDASAATGKPLATVTQAIAKAQAGNVASLSRLGIKTTEITHNTLAHRQAVVGLKSAQEAYDAAVKKGGPNSLAAQKASVAVAAAHQKLAKSQTAVTKTTLTTSQVMREMGKEFHGQAEARAHSLQGVMDRLHITFDELKETIGYKLLPVVQVFAQWFLNKGIPAIERFAATMREKLTPVFDRVRDAIKAAMPTVERVIQFLKDNPATVKAFAITLGILVGVIWLVTGAIAALTAVLAVNPFVLLAIGVAALVAGFVYAYTHSEKFRAVIQTIIGVVKDVAHWLGALPGEVKGWADAVSGFFTSLKDKVTGVVHDVRSRVDAIGGFFVSVKDKVTGAVQGAIDWLKQHWVPVVVTLISGPIGLAVYEVVKHWSAIKEKLAPALDVVKAAVGKVKDAVYALGDVGIWLWNHAFQPTIHLILTGLSTVIRLFADMVNALSHVPGFRWAGDAAKALGNAADQTQRLADNLHKLPTRKTVTIDQRIITTSSDGSVHTTGGHVPAMAEGGVVRARPGGTVIRVAEAGRDEAVVPLPRDGRTGMGAGIYVAGDYVVRANDYRDVQREQRRQLQLSAFAGRTPAGAQG